MHLKGEDLKECRTVEPAVCMHCFRKINIENSTSLTFLEQSEKIARKEPPPPPKTPSPFPHISPTIQ